MGSINYDAIVGRKSKVTLPSVDSWSSNMNILRDPSKGIFTQRRNRVGDTSFLNEAVEEEGGPNRTCEYINVFARGVNPSVSVSYDNNGSNGGQSSAFRTGGQTQAKLPFRIMNGGAFRPPVIMPEEKFSLSRQPRAWTSAYSAPGFADFSRKLRSCGTDQDTREVKSQTLKACVRPTAVYNIEKPLKEPFEVRYMIQPTLHTSANSGIHSQTHMNYLSTEPTKEINAEPLAPCANTNPSENRYVHNSEMYTEKYIQDSLAHVVQTNPSKNSTPIEHLFDLGDLHVKDETRHMSRTTPLSGYDKIDYIHEEIELPRSLPATNATTNFSDPRVNRAIQHQNIPITQRNLPMTSYTANPTSRPTISVDHGSRTAYLQPKVSHGSFSVPAQIPASTYIENNISNHETQRSKMSKNVYNAMQERYSHAPPEFGMAH